MCCQFLSPIDSRNSQSFTREPTQLLFFSKNTITSQIQVYWIVIIFSHNCLRFLSLHQNLTGELMGYFDTSERDISKKVVDNIVICPVSLSLALPGLERSKKNLNCSCSAQYYWSTNSGEFLSESLVQRILWSQRNTIMLI